MDGTQTNINLNGTLDDRSAFGFPLKHDWPPDAVISRCESVRPRSSEEIESCVEKVSDLVAIEMGIERQSIAESEPAGHHLNHESPYSADPYVADPGHPPSSRSLEEILESIQGYANAYELVDEQSNMEGPPTESDLPVDSDCDFSSDAKSTDCSNADLTELELDVINFVDACCDSERFIGDQPLPIRGGLEIELEDAQQGGVCVSVANQAIVAKSLETVSGIGDFNETDKEIVTGADGSSKRFAARDGDVIQIDGNDGFDYIDLECFRVSDASFQSNRIEIKGDDGIQFQVEYRNISHAVFSDGVEVEL